MYVDNSIKSSFNSESVLVFSFLYLLIQISFASEIDDWLHNENVIVHIDFYLLNLYIRQA
jgi:hypothetical protein